MADDRRLEPTRYPGVYRRHSGRCPRRGRCSCGYVVRWNDRDNKGRKHVFATLDAALDFKASLRSASGPRRPFSPATLDEYATGWLRTYRGRTARGLEESTRSEYEVSIRLHIRPYAIARLRIRDIGAVDIRDWVVELEAAGRSPTTIRKAKATIGVILATAAQDGEIAANPASSVRYIPSAAARAAHPKRDRKALTAADVEAILAAMTEPWPTFFLTLTTTGLRISELLGLTWGNVHLGDDPAIHVIEQVYEGERKRLKTDSSRGRVPISPTIAAILSDLRPDGAAPDAPVFPSTTGGPLARENVFRRVLQPALRDSGTATRIVDDDGKERWDYHGIAFHSFRRACGSLLLANGKTIKQVQGWLRHAQLTTTLNAYITQVDHGLGSADVWDSILPSGANAGANSGPIASRSGSSADE